MQQIGQTDNNIYNGYLFVLFIALCFIIGLVLTWFYTKLALKTFRKIGWGLEANHITDFSHCKTVLA